MDAVTAHTDACIYSRQGMRPGLDEKRPDYPWMAAVRRAHGQEGVDAVLACPSREHDSVRFMLLGRWRP